MTNYPVEQLDDEADNGTMPKSVAELANAVVGHRIVRADRVGHTFVLALDNGTQVELRDTDDCCAYTTVHAFLLHPERVEHVITGVGTTDEYTTWHIFVDMGDVLELTVGWSCGNPFYYSYGFQIDVVPLRA